MLSELQFLRPLWLFGFAPLGAALVWLARRPAGIRRWENVVDADLAAHVLIGAQRGTRIWPLALLGLAATLAILALAGPAWHKLSQPVFASEDPLVIALDLSRSMDAEDVAPSRLARARFKIADTLERRAEGQTALLVFAAEAYVVSPLTDDQQTIAAQLQALDTDLMPSQGSRVDRALAKAVELLDNAGYGDGDILLISDGTARREALDAASALRRAGYRLSVLGVGTPEGGPIPVAGGFLKDRDGSIVITRLEDDSLRALAHNGGGSYVALTPGPGDVERLTRAFTASQPGAVGQSELAADIWREEGPWLLLPLLPLAALVFRRGVLVVFGCALLLPPVPAQAFDWADLWSRPDRRALRALEAGEAERAAELFADPAWRGVAEYRAGDFAEALAALEGLDSVTAQYNRGNALARLGRYEDAIAAYETVLERDPAHEDARHNRDLLQQQAQQNAADQGGGEPRSDNAASGDAGQTDPKNAEPQDGSQGQPGSQDAGAQAGAEEQSAGQDAAAGQHSAQTRDGTDAQDDDEDRAAEQGTASHRGDGADTRESAGADAQDQALADAREALQRAAESGDPGQASEESAPAALAGSEQPPDESEQAVEQWLRRIPDDPGGLLRRKFLYQYRRQQQPLQEPEPW